MSEIGMIATVGVSQNEDIYFWYPKYMNRESRSW
jgi:hypothetical protein